MVKYDPYVKRYISLEDYIRECYGGLPNESMLEEQWNALPDHPGKINTMDPKNITRLSSHTYELPVFRITENGAEVAETVIVQFCKGTKTEEGQVGFFAETLIELCKMHLESVNQGDLKNPYTTAATRQLEDALWYLQERINDRQARGVFQTYQK